jgi:hypothetical protein
LAKSKYFKGQILDNKNDNKKLWHNIKSLGYSNNKKESPKIVLSNDGETYHDPCRVASHFNNFFTNIASNLVQKLPAAKNLYSVASDTIRNFYRNISQKDFHLHHILSQPKWWEKEIKPKF